MNPHDEPLRIGLFLLRISVFVVMFMWTLDKFINPDHAAAVYTNFYYLGGMSPMAMRAIGVVELAILLAFLAGLAKTWTYGAVLVFHGISTLSSYQQYLAPFEGTNLLFFAAWPMLAACGVLFMLRAEDRLGTWS